jgi:hypothetical protein
VGLRDAPLIFHVPAAHVDRIDLDFHVIPGQVEDKDNLRVGEVCVFPGPYSYRFSDLPVHLGFQGLGICKPEVAPDHLLTFCNKRRNPRPDKKRGKFNAFKCTDCPVCPFINAVEPVIADPAGSCRLFKGKIFADEI